MVGQSYAPEPTSVGPYTTDLAEHLAQLGHDVTVIAAFPHYPQWRWQVDRPPFRLEESRNGVPVRRIRPVLPRIPSQTLWRLTFDVSLGMTALIESLRVSKPDVVICISPPVQTGLIGMVRWPLRRPAFVVQAHDLPSQAGAAVGMYRQGWFYRIATAVEMAFYRRADCVVVISQRFADKLAQLGLDAKKVQVIANWGRYDGVAGEPSAAARAELGVSADQLLAVHTGNMGEKQGLKNVVHAADLMQDLPWARFALVGDGPQSSHLRAQIADRGLQNLVMLPLQSSDRFKVLLASSDVLVLNQRRGVVDSVVPSKLLTYMAAGKPILAAVHPSSTAAEIVERAACGIVVEPENPAAFVEGMIKLRQQQANLAELGARARQFAEEHFSREKRLHDWDVLIGELGAKTSRGSPKLEPAGQYQDAKP